MSIFKAFNVEPVKVTKEELEHTCGENGCGIKVVTKEELIYPELKEDHYKEIVNLLIDNVGEISADLTLEIVAILERIKNDMQ